MRQVLGWLAVVALCCAAATPVGEVQPDARLQEAQSAFDEAKKLEKAVKYAEAVVQGEHALALREAVLGDAHPEVASCLNLLGHLQRLQGNLDRAEPLLQRAISIREAALGKDHPEVAKSITNLANIYVEQGFYGRAVPLYQRGLAIREAALGKNHPEVAMSLNNLAVVHQLQGLYGQAEPLSARALAIREAALGKDHPDVAQSVHNLGHIYENQGLFDRAVPLYQRSSAVWEAALGKDHPLIANSLNNLGGIYALQGLYDRAQPLLERALAIREAAFGQHHPHVAVSLNNLASLYKKRGLFSQAVPLYQRSISIAEATLGKDHPDIAESLHNLADIHVAKGLYGQATPLHQRALAIWEAAYGKHHPYVAASLHALAGLRLAQHRLSEALPLFTRAFAISEQRLRQEALDFSESRLSGFLHHLREDEQRLYALLRAHPEDVRVRRLVLGAVLLRKGRSVEETANISRALYRSLGAEDRGTFERLRGLRHQLATLSLAGPGALPLAEHQQRLATLTAEGDALEADLARRSAPLRALTGLPPPAQVVNQVASALPRDGALVELIAYRDGPLAAKPGAPSAKPPEQPRYLALVLFPDASTRAVDLGPAAPIDLAASRLRSALASRDASFQATARELHRLAFQPLRALLGNTRRLFVSPDGQLGLVPFSALHDGRRFLLDSFDFVYLTSGRQLLPRPQERAPSSSVFVLADPDFNASSKASLAVEPSGDPEPFFSTMRASLDNEAWVPLPGTRQEAESIQRLLPQARLFLGPEATKERLLQLPTPGILHLATHGFFLGDEPSPAPGSRAVGHFGALGDNPRAPGLREPLLRSGLALAGARAPAPESSTPSGSRSETALVTALELAGLDLWGTQLVVLSACDTGRGEVQPGQGIYGLRRALVVAGAETVVMSLWKVDDDSTRLLMDAYYRNLLAGQGRASALREAMHSLRESRPHPHHWAPFIALGSDAPLRAITPTR